jgi:hypothetical protein
LGEIERIEAEIGGKEHRGFNRLGVAARVF